MRRKSVGALLSALVFPGVGQYYLGRRTRALLFLARQWRHLLFAGSTLLVTAIGNTTLKHGFARARPDVLSEPLTTYSFPSGHSSAAFAFFLVLGVLAGRGQSSPDEVHAPTIYVILRRSSYVVVRL